ncbi:MAG: serine hydrolase [Puia sp.]|nr:serine hydrolase [Puia sp.]
MNYCLLGLLIEKLSGQTLQNYFIKYIFQPAGMRHTYIENLILTRTNSDRTVNYEYPALYDSALVKVDSIANNHRMIYNLGGFYGQGGLTSTSEDLFRFDKAFFSGLLIGPAEMAEALTPVKLNNGKIAEASSDADLGPSGYGFGWFVVNDTTRGKIVWHPGGRPGISSVHLHNLRTDQTVVVLQNTPNPSTSSAICAYHVLNRQAFTPLRGSLIQAYARTLVKEGPDAAMTRLNVMRSDTTYKMPDDYWWLILGWQLFEKDNYAGLSAETFKIGCLLFPNAWYMTQGYGAALEKEGKKELAILMYKKAIAQWPQADYAPGRLKVLEAR